MEKTAKHEKDVPEGVQRHLVSKGHMDKEPSSAERRPEAVSQWRPQAAVLGGACSVPAD